MEKEDIVAKLGPTIGTSLKNWFKLIIKNGFISLKHLPRAFLIIMISLIGIPFRIGEHWIFKRKIERTTIKYPPIFIIGHWRSGTTFLHNLLCQDPQFGYISMLEATFPRSFIITNFFKWFMKIFLPELRPMDNMKMAFDLPQEEEMALSNLTPYNFYNSLYFPKKMMRNYKKYVMFMQASQGILEGWFNAYNYLLKKTTLYQEGKQLVLKNPANTARIKFILEKYPNAKFIHIYRNPYKVYLSTLHLYKRAIKVFMLQDIAQEKLKHNIIEIYDSMMRKYFKDKKLIPENNLIEVQYEQFEKTPLEQLKLIYSQFGFQGFNTAKNYFEKYLNSLKNYRKNVYNFSKKTVIEIKNKWKYTLEKWGYKEPELVH